jgi:hypothetical protein
MVSVGANLRRRPRLAIAGAVVVAGLGAAPAGADPSGKAQLPAASAGAFLVRDGRFTPLGTIPGAAASGHVNANNRGQVVGLDVDAAEAAATRPGRLPTIRSFVKDPRGRVTTFAVPGASATVATGITTAARSSSPSWPPASRR